MPSPESPQKIRISIDRGGTFTDCVASVPGKEDIVIKLLSVDPENYKDAPSEAIRRVLEMATGKSFPKGQKISLADVESIKMGTTVATNALLERNGEPTVFCVSEGLKDLLHIGNQARPRLFDLAINRPGVLYSDVIEVSERVTLEDWTERSDSAQVDPTGLVRGVTGEWVRVLKPLDVAKVTRELRAAYAQGYRSVAVCLMHSYTFPDHERVIGEVAEEIGFDQISLSCVAAPSIKIVPRGHAAVADAYLTPQIKKYIDGFVSGFEDLDGSDCRCEFMQSDGGLVEFKRLSGLRAVLSGPAGGVVGYARTCYDDTDKTPLIGFDMGGTSTDVSRFAGELEHVFETTTAGVVISTPQLDINTVAAGGGSILSWRNGLFNVGPESASSHPGPACYRKGGPLTITDANLVLGRINADSFPHIFGPNADEPLDISASRKLFGEMTSVINGETGGQLTMEEVAAGFLSVANESMCRPIRILTEAKGHDSSLHNLASFGGAGGQHACELAAILGIRRVLIHKYSSILSAYGMALADVVHEERQPAALQYCDSSLPIISEALDKLSTKAEDVLIGQSISPARMATEKYLSLRFHGSDTAIMVPQKEGSDVLQAFKDAHLHEFGFVPEGRAVIVDEFRVRSVGKSPIESSTGAARAEAPAPAGKTAGQTATGQTPVYFEGRGWVDAPVYRLNGLDRGSTIQGPALILDNTQTIVVTPNAAATVQADKIVIDLTAGEKASISSTKADPVQLSIFAHRFMGVAEQMGRALQRTSVSTNIKERLDFSCTVFSPDGGLVANAPHVPAMIGSMAYAVKWQIDHWKGDLAPGDVILSNSPVAGGTHLPDLTVITPVFDTAGRNIIFWTASRGHHADVGGVLPGSMPPNSRELWEEGAVIESFKVVQGDRFNEDELTRLLLAPGKIPGCSGTRCLKDNISDIKAQVAANHRGTQLIRALYDDYGKDVVTFYMGEVQAAAELAVRDLLKAVHKKHAGRSLEATDYMDDGTPISLKVTIDGATGDATFDFTGTGPEAYGNWNAPIAITHSAIIFALRSFITHDIPLNQGCIRPIRVHVPDDCLLKPSGEAACCAGNVLTSQRIVDVIFRAFGASAASQGCMNNLTFGIDDATGETPSGRGFGYYETICGGSGAGPWGDGTAGVHTNMTNTRITDPEVLERRYPVVLRRFCLRPGSGGDGAFRGGDGVVRDVEFSVPMKVSILSERRVVAPYGLHGGRDGERGRNLWIRAGGRVLNLGGKNTASVGKGDRIVIQTPGGGGWGDPKARGASTAGAAGCGRGFVAVGNGSVDVISSMGQSA
ncbi:5-oxoprolinase (atp-hydrolyzing) [Diplodia corticola]|uniref:5-oxoprolinase (Atp-hydrolysing) n=1 Tax=Diplodia corticola TaxID=236234 RepID=A0A1J9RPM7_9PEZI|nr:5-oxoprolinase (atp-hydrolyzing) [Diplodia corticola]OJD29868.1 5-oxoprolinase (atp-hydrolysing) [Diplodia corticola]